MANDHSAAIDRQLTVQNVRVEATSAKESFLRNLFIHTQYEAVFSAIS